ncbi:MAG: hypothetical protein J5504_10165 [Butyrivibrio sp.]|nr:hypothetical protein [Butyrivibrio sp.]
MAGINGISASSGNSGVDKTSFSNKTDQVNSSKSSQSAKTETKSWSPIDTKSSLVPRVTDYGMTIGNVELSDTAKSYLDKLKSKFHNMEFITVSKDMKAQVQQNAAAYGNANKMVVLIDEEKLERMATDENFRNKYEGIIASSQAKMLQAKMGLTSSGANIKNFGMSVDSNGKENFFATVGNSLDQQKKRIEKKAAEKKAEKAKEKKQAEKEAREERLQKAKDKKAESGKFKADKNVVDEAETEEYAMFEADSMDELISKVQTYSYNASSNKVMTDSERTVGTTIDFKG